MIPALLLATILVAWANGANDNFKGVATLYGTGAAGYRTSLGLATGATLAGSMAAIVTGRALARAFAGKGLVPDSLSVDPRFFLAVAGGAALTVLAASRLGMPISTTHSLLGALIGAGMASAGPRMRWDALGPGFVYPLLFSPLLSMLLTLLLYPLFRGARRILGVGKETCLCVGETITEVDLLPGGAAVLRSTGVRLTVDQLSICRSLYVGRVAGLSAQGVLNRLHLLSAAAVSFARGLNDTPKIAALMIASGAATSPGWFYLVVGGAMAAGGLLGARRVAETMSHRITDMNDGQGFSANLATAFLVVVASNLGLPVSTTHVSVGALFGIGLAGRRAKPEAIARIVLAWVTTLPLAAALGAALLLLLQSAG